MRAFVFFVAAVAACLVMAIVMSISRASGRRKIDPKLKEFINEISILEDPDLMEEGLQQILLEENAKNRKASMAEHPSGFDDDEKNHFPAQTEFGHLARHAMDQAKKNKKRGPYSSSDISYEVLRRKFRRN